MKAIWNDVVLANSDKTVLIEGNHYFPTESLNLEFFQYSDKQTTCPWKGVAHYYNLSVDGQLNEAAAWFYPSPKPQAAEIKNHVAFWKGVKII